MSFPLLSPLTAPTTVPLSTLAPPASPLPWTPQPQCGRPLPRLDCGRAVEERAVVANGGGESRRRQCRHAVHQQQLLRWGGGGGCPRKGLPQTSAQQRGGERAWSLRKGEMDTTARSATARRGSSAFKDPAIVHVVWELTRFDAEDGRPIVDVLWDDTLADWVECKASQRIGRAAKKCGVYAPLVLPGWDEFHTGNVRVALSRDSNWPKRTPPEMRPGVQRTKCMQAGSRSTKRERMLVQDSAHR